MFDFQKFKIVLLATINSIVVLSSILLNLHTVLLLKIYNQKRQLDELTKDSIISRNVALERVKRLKRRYNIIHIIFCSLLEFGVFSAIFCIQTYVIVKIKILYFICALLYFIECC